jgi:tetratricopeptide (TPR) repeat protein
MAAVLDLEQSLLLLELEPPFGKREVQLARRRLAKVWHPDLAPPGKQLEHERHIKAINDAADQLSRLAEGSRGGSVSANHVRASAAAAREARAEAGRRAYESRMREQEVGADRRRHDPFAGQVPDHSVVHRYARCLSYPEWGVGTVTGIYFTGEGDAMQQWARMRFAAGVRTVPAGSLQFVDFSRPDPGAERVQRFVTAAQHAMAEGEFKLAARRLIYARDAEPQNTAVLRLMTLAFWQGGDLTAAARAVRDWARAERDRPAPQRFAARIYEDMGALDLAAEAAQRAVDRGPADAGAWERLGRLRLRLYDRRAAREALERARELMPSVEGLLDLALAYQLAGDIGGEVTACEQAVALAEGGGDRDEDDADDLDAARGPAASLLPSAWSRLAHALARTDRASDAAEACERALALGDDPEVSDLLEHLRALEPRVLPAV